MTVQGEYNYGTYNSGLYNLGFDEDDFVFDFTTFYPIEVLFSTRVIDKEDGTEQRLRLMASGIHTFGAEEIAVDTIRKGDLEDFMFAKLGNIITFSLTDPVTDSSYTVRFVDSETVFRHRPDTRWDFNTSFVEVRK